MNRGIPDHLYEQRQQDIRWAKDRMVSREDGDFARSDWIRDDLMRSGWEVRDLDVKGPEDFTRFSWASGDLLEEAVVSFGGKTTILSRRWRLVPAE